MPTISSINLGPADTPGYDTPFQAFTTVNTLMGMFSAASANTTLWTTGSGNWSAISGSALLDNIIGSTQGMIAYRNATTWVGLAPGTSGQFLQTLGAGANPAWATVSGGSGTVTSVNASGGTTGFSFSGGPITGAGTLTLSGTLALTNGGTGATNATDARTNLGLGNIATQSASSVAITGGSITGITDLAIADGGTGASTAADARTNLGLVIGTDVQAYNAYLADIAGITPSQGDILYFNGTDWVRLAAGTSGQVLQTNGAGANPSWVTPGGGGFTTAKLTSDVTSSSTSLGNVTGLSVSLSASTYYTFEAFLVYQTAATTTGLSFSMTGPTTPTVFTYLRSIVTTNTAGADAINDQGGNGDDATATKTTGIDVANSNRWAYIQGIIVTAGSSGNLQVRFASEVAASDVTVKQGSMLRVQSY